MFSVLTCIQNHCLTSYIYRFLNCSDKLTNNMKSDIDQLITDYKQKPNSIEGMETIITNITSMQSMSKKGKFLFSTPFVITIGLITQDSKKEKDRRTTLQGTATIYYGFLKTKIEEITCQLLQGCDLCNSTCLKKGTKIPLGHLSHNLSKGITEKKLQIMCHP